MRASGLRQRPAIMIEWAEFTCELGSAKPTIARPKAAARSQQRIAPVYSSGLEVLARRVVANIEGRRVASAGSATEANGCARSTNARPGIGVALAETVCISTLVAWCIGQAWAGVLSGKTLRKLHILGGVEVAASEPQSTCELGRHGG